MYGELTYTRQRTGNMVRCHKKRRDLPYRIQINMINIRFIKVILRLFKFLAHVKNYVRKTCLK